MSVAGLLARAMRTSWLASYLEKEAILQRHPGGGGEAHQKDNANRDHPGRKWN